MLALLALLAVGLQGWLYFALLRGHSLFIFHRCNDMGAFVNNMGLANTLLSAFGKRLVLFPPCVFFLLFLHEAYHVSIFIDGWGFNIERTARYVLI